MLARNSTGSVIRNLVCADNGAGVAFAACVNVVLVNSTIDSTESTAMRVSACRNVTIFNNLFTYASRGIDISGQNSALVIDHNNYIATSVGHLEGEAPRKKAAAWASLTGYDRHSLTIDVKYANTSAGDYRPTSRLSWQPDRATTGVNGIAQLAGTAAPATDIDGAPRKGGHWDLGAYQTSFTVPRPPDGSLKVTSGAGVASAGLYTPTGKLVAYLFQNLPLPKGKHPYWLPARNWQGQPIASGKYLLKLAESQLSLDYIAAAGNGDLESSINHVGAVEKRASLDPSLVGFDRAGRVVVAQSGFETGQAVRTYDTAMSHILWSIPGGDDYRGLTTDTAGNVLVMNRSGGLIRLKTPDGGYLPFLDGSVLKDLSASLKQVDGMTWLNDKLYVADAAQGRLLVCSGDDLGVVATLAAPGIVQPAADSAAGLIWALAGAEVVALDTAGTEKYRAKLVEEPKFLAASPGYLAVYSKVQRKISVFDTRNPTQPRLLHTIGDGSDGYGPMKAERLWEPRSIAIDGNGQVALCDPPRVCLFGSDGAARRMAMGMWGQAISYGWFGGDSRAHFFNIGGNYDIALDAKARTWQPGTRWRMSMPDCTPIFYFNTGGRNFGLFSRRTERNNTIAIGLMQPDGVCQILAQYGFDQDGMYYGRDTDGDGIIKDSDPTGPVLGPDGKRITRNFIDENFWATDTRRDGSLAILRGDGMLTVPMTGLDALGVPHYDFAHQKFVPATINGDVNYNLPYDFSKPEKISLSRDLSQLQDGGFVAQVTAGDGPTGGEGSTGHSVARFDSAGSMLWYNPLTPAGLNLGTNGITNLGGITVAARGQLAEFECIDADGLGLGTLGTPRNMGWMGMWLDNPRQMQGFSDEAGNPYLIVGDYCAQAYHWLALANTRKILRQTQPVVLTGQAAARLAAALPAPVAPYPAPAVPHVTIKRLAAELPIDGDAAKWRTQGIRPIVVSADDATRNSAVLRMGYTDSALYVQVIKFAKVLTFHHTEPGQHYQQDGIEFNIGSFWDGWKYNITRLGNKDDIVLRDRFLGGSTLLTPEQAPRTITLIDSAADVPERKLLDAASGVDMSSAKVMIIEFKLGEAALNGLPANKALAFASGKSFIFGFTCNHNNVLGTNQFEPLQWPVMYGTFSRDPDLATAVFE